MTEEARLRIGDREELIYMLAEAAAIEHNVMCCYLYGIWSLKRGERDGLTPAQAATVKRWKNAMLNVAIEEMTHLTIVGNLVTAIGGTPHLSRPEFPIRAGYHPAGIDLELVGFSPALVDHAIYLERPEGMEMSDAPEFIRPDDYHRAMPKGAIMPSAQDYQTIGHLYRGIYHGFEVLNRRYGAQSLFCGTVDEQIGPGDAALPGLKVVTDLASAHDAIETIVEQGEGAPAHSEDSHYNAFLAVKDELAAMMAADPTFAPAHPVARNPRPRLTDMDEGCVLVTNPEALRAMDLGNALYNLMLRFLAQSWGRDSANKAAKKLYVDQARHLMRLLMPVGEYLASLPAGPEYPGVTAGMSFTLARDIQRLPLGDSEPLVLAERTHEIVAHCRHFFPQGHELSKLADKIEEIGDKITPPAAGTRAPKAKIVHDDLPSGKRELATDPAAANAPESAEAKDLTLHFDTQRCIHARHCVLGAPEVFLANVVGPWLHPETMETGALRTVCVTCPSGAISYTPKGDLPPEPAPQVNTIRLRENGPYAVNATIEIDGKSDGFRATLCRCGASKNKPWCDGSHKEIGFSASGEPDTRPSEPLKIRGDVLAIRPEKDGPLQIDGNLEIITGTGRTVDRLTSVRLCRCGGSSNKPFCDNTHLKIGFKST